MAIVRSVTFLVVLTFLLNPARGDDEVFCVFMERCILPCRFQVGAEIIIHWIQVRGRDIQVHSYYHNQDQLSLQNQHFSKRTSLFRDQISSGNASLQLREVGFQDQGRYKCYTSTITGKEESFINLKVEAPVRKVDIQQVENRITCSSDGIYPEPKLIWSTSPQSNVTFQNIEVQQTEQQLYNISRSLILSDNAGDVTYTCTVSTERSSRRATLRTLPPISSSVTTTIHCPPSNIFTTSLVWRFNHSQTILNRTGDKVSYNEEWRPQVKDVSVSGDLMLQGLSSNQEGIYTCELSNAEETYITNIFLRIENSQGSSTTAGIIGGVLGILALVICLLILFFKNKKAICEKFKKKETGNRKDSEPGVKLSLKETHESP